jgi:hypothetical protein
MNNILADSLELVSLMIMSHLVTMIHLVLICEVKILAGVAHLEVAHPGVAHKEVAPPEVVFKMIPNVFRLASVAKGVALEVPVETGVALMVLEVSLVPTGVATEVAVLQVALEGIQVTLMTLMVLTITGVALQVAGVALETTGVAQGGAEVIPEVTGVAHVEVVVIHLIPLVGIIVLKLVVLHWTPV